MFNALVNLHEVRILQDDKLILENVSLKLFHSELIYLIGKVGSGKTSFLKTLYAELPLDSGKAIVNEFELHNIPSRKIPYLRRSLGIVFQDFRLLTDRNVHENLRFVLEATGWKDKSKTEARIKQVLADVMLSDKEYSMPNELSGGEQQRVVIARALLNEPPLILADEPTGNLDPDSSAQVMEILRKLSLNGSTVIIATHQYNLIKQYPGRVFKIDNYQLFEIELNEI
jgi:cell division transport system ATP-binding protein